MKEKHYKIYILGFGHHGFGGFGHGFGHGGFGHGFGHGWGR